MLFFLSCCSCCSLSSKLSLNRYSGCCCWCYSFSSKLMLLYFIWTILWLSLLPSLLIMSLCCCCKLLLLTPAFHPPPPPLHPHAVEGYSKCQWTCLPSLLPIHHMYICRVQSCVWRLPKYWPPPPPPSSQRVCPPSAPKAGGYTLAGRWGGGGPVFGRRQT
jgi:hypothetical protein